MVNYQKGKIYKIISPHTDKCYVGSTTKDRLSNRLAQHRSDFKNGRNCTSKYILELGDYEIVLLELCPCNSKDELHMRERHYMESLDCVNKQIPNRSYKEWYIANKDKISEYQTEYRLNNKDKSKEYQTEYQLNNKDKIKETKKEYRLKNKDKIKDYQKGQYLKNKDAIAEKTKIKITCECGCVIRKNDILRHKKSQKHIKLMESQSSL